MQLFYFLLLALQVDSQHPTCNFLLEVEREQAECVKRLREEEAAGRNKGSHLSQTTHRVTVPDFMTEISF